MSSASPSSATRRRMKLRRRACSRFRTSEMRASWSTVIRGMSAVAFILDYAGCKYNPHPYVMTDEWRKYCDSCRGNLLWSWRASSLRCREFEVSYADPKVPVELKSPEAALKAAALHLLPEAVLPFCLIRICSGPLGEDSRLRRRRLRA